jgi:hypothetical protein
MFSRRRFGGTAMRSMPVAERSTMWWIVPRLGEKRWIPRLRERFWKGLLEAEEKNMGRSGCLPFGIQFGERSFRNVGLRI